MGRVRWGVLVALVSLVLAWSLSSGDKWARGAEGDGYYAWLFARSLVYDHDLDFTNDYSICGDRWKVGADRGTGHPNNNFSFGQVVFWVPALELARVVVPLPVDAPPEVRASCKGPRVSFVLYLSPIIGALTVFLSYLVARRFASDGAAALAAGLVAVAGTNLAYAGFMVSYSHVYASFAVALLFWTSLRAEEKPTALRFVGVGLALGLAILQRPTEGIFGLVPLVVLWRLHRRGDVSLGRAARLFAIVSAGGAAGLIPLLAVYTYLYGGPFVVPQGRYFMFLGHGHPWLVLFAPRGGLFFSAPTAWLGVVGFVLALRDRRHRLLFAAMLGACVVELYIASCALDWHESWGFGARRLTTLTPALVAAAAFFFERGRVWLRRRPARARTLLGISWLVPACFATYGVIGGTAHDVIVPDFGHSQAAFWGEGSRWTWGMLDEHVGDLAIYPAELVFAARYGLPPTSFRDATAIVYARVQRGDMHFTLDHLPIDEERIEKTTRGFERHDGVLRLVGRRGTFVFGAEWPFATGLDLVLDAPEATKVRVGIGRTFGVDWQIGWTPVAGKGFALHVPLTNGAFDSGIDEVIIERDGPALDVRSFTIRDAKFYPPAM